MLRQVSVLVFTKPETVTHSKETCIIQAEWFVSLAIQQEFRTEHGGLRWPGTCMHARAQCRIARPVAQNFAKALRAPDKPWKAHKVSSVNSSDM